MEDFLPATSVFLLALVELWAAIPLGFALGLPPLGIAALSGAGALSGAFLVLVLGSGFRGWLMKWHGHKSSPDSLRKVSVVERLWNRWGAMGLGFLAPLLVGAPLGMVMGLAGGADARKLALWMTVGVLSWTSLLVALGMWGVNFLTPGEKS